MCVVETDSANPSPPGLAWLTDVTSRLNLLPLRSKTLVVVVVVVVVVFLFDLVDVWPLVAAALLPA